MQRQDELIILKLGTSSLVNEHGKLDGDRFKNIADQVIEMRQNYNVAIVSSAAISAGAAELQVDRSDYIGDLDGLSMLAGVGQPIKFEYWRQAFAGRAVVSQHLATPRELRSDKRESAAFHRKLSRVICDGIIADINENDAIADDEIKVGDNDVISALVVRGLSRTNIWRRIHLVNLTDVDGFYNGDPTHHDSRVIAEVNDIAAVSVFSSGAGSKHGTGGGDTKLAAARIVVNEGQYMYLANSRAKNAIKRAIRREIGTVFVPAHVQ